jgi:hypothetical protein
MRILVAEDDALLASFIKKGLESEHYAVDVSFDELGRAPWQGNPAGWLELAAWMPARERRKWDLPVPRSLDLSDASFTSAVAWCICASMMR